MESFWKNAIREVLAEERVPMRSKDIARKIVEKNKGMDLGNTPENTVNKYLRENKDLFKRLRRGEYELAEVSVTKEIDWGDIDWDDIDWDIDDDEQENDRPKFKPASSFVDSPVPSQDEKDLLELIVNFPLPLANGEVCFAGILDKMGMVEFSDEEKKRDQSIDRDLLEQKLDELKKQIDEIERKAEYDHKLKDLHGDLLRGMKSAAERAQDLLLDAPGETVEFDVPVLGEFVPGREGVDKPKVVLYYENIQRSTRAYSLNFARWVVMAGVFVHEMFHAWNYFKAGRSSNSVLAIDEPMVEFESLYFLKELTAFADSQDHRLRKLVSCVGIGMKDRVQDKQQEVGDQAAYGFGYYLFNNLSDDDSRKWIETYSEKSASINDFDLRVKKVKDALIPVYPFQPESKSEADILKLFRKIIFDRHAISVTTGKSPAATSGLHVSLRDLVLACIETIGRKCFDAHELYAFAPIFKVCVPQCMNLEEALKQQLDELVKDGVLEPLPYNFYSMK